MSGIFIDGFSDEGDVFREFEVPPDEQDIEIIVASYSYENYEGDSTVFFKKGDTYYEVYGGHCSCYGLEGQWTPEPVELEVLKERISRKTRPLTDYEKEVLKYIMSQGV